MNIQSVVLTSPQRRSNHSYDQLGKVLVYCDYLHFGAALATNRAITFATRLSPDSHILFVEDDVELCEDFWARVNALEFPVDVGIISLHDMREMSSGCADGLYPRSALGSDGHGWWGNQALLIHHDVAHMLVAMNWFCDDIEKSPGIEAHKVAYCDNGRNCSDIRLSLVVNSLPFRNKYAVHVPSLVRHVGHQSLCFPDRPAQLGERETKNWIGNRI
jgi:hypothetical protein